MNTGLRVLGVVENMSDIRIPFSSLGDPLAGISLVTKEGQDVTQIMMQRYVVLFQQCNSFSLGDLPVTFLKYPLIHSFLFCTCTQNPRDVSGADGPLRAVGIVQAAQRQYR